MAKKLTDAQLIHQNSGKTEYYTPDYILNAATQTMGIVSDPIGHNYPFDLDPASSAQANRHVRAIRYFTEQLNGLNHQWVAETVWLNHPYGRENNKAWIDKAIEEYRTGRAKQICMICWASTSEKWFHPLFQFPMCFIHHRVRFIDPSRKLASASTKSSVVVYMGPRLREFSQWFSYIGYIMWPETMTIVHF